MNQEDRNEIINSMVNHMKKSGGSIGIEESQSGLSDFYVNGHNVSATSEEVGDMVLDAIDLYENGNVA